MRWPRLRLKTPLVCLRPVKNRDKRALRVRRAAFFFFLIVFHALAR
jgi:hypothetical protein